MLLSSNETMKGKILIIEDEAAIREMLGYALMKDGYSFLEAADVEQARPRRRAWAGNHCPTSAS